MQNVWSNKSIILNKAIFSSFLCRLCLLLKLVYNIAELVRARDIEVECECYDKHYQPPLQNYYQCDPQQG